LFGVHVPALGDGQSALPVHGIVHRCSVPWANGSQRPDVQSLAPVHVVVHSWASASPPPDEDASPPLDEDASAPPEELPLLLPELPELLPELPPELPLPELLPLEPPESSAPPLLLPLSPPELEPEPVPPELLLQAGATRERASREPAASPSAWASFMRLG
jgi:hypothetical protein